MVPDSLQGVELGGVGGQIVDFEVLAVVGEPGPDGPVFVVGGVVLDEVDLAGEVAGQQPFQVREIGVGVEDLLKLVAKPGGVEFDGAEDLEARALAGGRDFRLRTDPAPGLVEGGILPEGGFVFEEEGGPFAARFFLMRG